MFQLVINDFIGIGIFTIKMKQKTGIDNAKQSVVHSLWRYIHLEYHYSIQTFDTPNCLIISCCMSFCILLAIKTLRLPVDHNSDVITGAMESQITSLAIVYSIVYLGVDQRKHKKICVTGLCAGNSPVTGKFPAQRACNAEKKLMTSSCDIYIYISILSWVNAIRMHTPFCDIFIL